MSVKDQISTDLKVAMKARDQVRLDTLRSVLSAFTYKRVEAGHDPTDDEQLALVQKLVKQRTDSIAEFTKGGRTRALVEKETAANATFSSSTCRHARSRPTRSPRDRPLGARPTHARRGAQPGGRDEGGHAATQGLSADGNVVRQIVTEELANA